VHDLVLRDSKSLSTTRPDLSVVYSRAAYIDQFGNIRAERPVLVGEDAVRVSGGNDE